MMNNKISIEGTHFGVLLATMNSNLEQADQGI